MQFEPWMFAAMEEYGQMDTRTGRINKVARFLARENLEYIGNEEFIRACHACNVDPYGFDQEDIQKVERKLRELWIWKPSENSGASSPAP